MIGRSCLRARLAAASVGLVLSAVPAAAPVTAAAAATPVTSIMTGETAEWNHDPASPIGPTHWGELDPAWSACASVEGQSPIAVTATREADLPVLLVHYPRTPLAVHNTGHVIEVPQPPGGGGTLLVGGHSYRLLQWHTHVPSEHVVNGHRADLEIHLVHQDEQGQIAVLAVFADVVSSGPAVPPTPAADLLGTTVQAAPRTAGEETDLDQKGSAAVLLQAAGVGWDDSRVIPSYLTYTGSLTTPPCTGGVQWFLLPGIIGVDQATVQRLHILIASFPGYEGYPNNNRPLQPVGSRMVERRVCWPSAGGVTAGAA
jgi:carbonic anhydrase